LGQKISITSHKPQTTRQSIKGIYNSPKSQIVFLDTPGYVEPVYELHNKLLVYLKNSLKKTNLIILVSQYTSFPTNYDRKVIDIIQNSKCPKILIFNKIDLLKKNELSPYQNSFFDEIFYMSAKNDTPKKIIKLIESFMPHSIKFYDTEYLTDIPMKFLASELIREQVFKNYNQEIPYSCAVTIEKYIENENNVQIYANIWLEKKSQKIILIGKGGSGLKKIRINSEKNIHLLEGKRVKMHLWVKLKLDWKKKKNALKEFGYY